MRRFALVSVVLVSCTGGSAKQSAPASSSAVGATERVMATLSAMPTFAEHLGKGVKLEPTLRGLGLQRKGFHVAGGVAPIAPARANEPLRFEDAATGFYAEIVDDSLRDTAAEVREGAVVYPNALPSGGDLAHVVEPSRVEELRVVRTQGVFDVRYSIQVPSGDVRLRDDRVEIFDAHGVLRVSSAPLFAVDANGVRRHATISLEKTGSEWSLRVSHDTRGMTAPIVLDPVWQLTSSTSLPSLIPPTVVAATPTLALLFSSTPYSYDTTTDTWTARATTGHSGTFTATLVPSQGKILIAGGDSTAGLYSFGATYGITPTGALAATRFDHGAVLLGDGGAVPERVFAVGGRKDSSTVLVTTEWWDPGTGTWSARAPLNTPRYTFGLAKFTDGSGKQKVLAAGGHNGGDTDSTGEVYDPIGNTWTPAANAMAVRRGNNVTVTLPNNKVLIAGGATSTYCCTYTETTSIYDPATNTFSAGPSMKYTRTQAEGILLPSGKVLVAGGSGHLASAPSDPNVTLSTTELYDYTTNTWSDGPNMVNARYGFGLVGISGGRALAIVGGSGGGYVSTAEVFYPDPVVCTTTGPGCANCVDGYCCDSACGGQCQACDVSGREGICSNVNGEAPHGSRAACSPFLSCAYSSSTGTSSCATSCTGDTNCATGSFCSAGTCVAKKSNGAACTGANQCTSGQCVDGYCCESACTGQCSSCGEAGNLGKCVPVDGAPRGTRAACTTTGYGCVAGACGSTCTKDAQCVGANYCSGGACVPKQANGATCTAGTQCSSATCSDGYCCTATCTGTCSACGPSGTCAPVASGPPPAGKTCGAYANCSAGACSTSCGSDSDCTSGFYCNASAKCVVRKAGGAACLGNSECTSGNCASGVCCDSACTGECEACNLAGSIGTCKVRPSGTSCGLAGCVGGYTVATSTCDGTSNTCPLGTITPCPNGVKCLDKVSCKASCATDSDCVVGACDTSTGKCVSAWDGGLDMGVDSTADTTAADTAADTPADTTEMDSTADTTVADSSMPDGTTGETASDIGIAEVSSPPFQGVTSVTGDFQRCTKGSECPTGHCVEGVCCDTACTDRCHSCALLTSPGKCTLEPVGVDLKSECGPALSCLGTCGPAGECIGSGDGTMCARNRCTGPSTGAGPAYCSAPGAACSTDSVVPFDCSPYVCEPAFGACRTSCAASTDCAQGFVCDVGSKTCVPAPTEAAGTADNGGGGCALSTTQTTFTTSAWALAAIALGAVRRRRRN